MSQHLKDDAFSDYATEIVLASDCGRTTPWKRLTMIVRPAAETQVRFWVRTDDAAYPHARLADAIQTYNEVTP